MKVAVIGSRGYNDFEKVKSVLSEYEIELLVSGGAVGADKMGEKYANDNGIPTLIFPAEWDKYGKGAGYIRNKLIVENADLVVAFWDMKSKGTQHSINLCGETNTELVIINTNLH